MIYRGSLGEISNKADWVSRVYTLVNESDDTEVDLSSDAITVAIEIVIRRPGSCENLISGSLDDSKIVLNGTGFQWQFTPDDLSCLCAGTYDVGVAVTIDDVKDDIILASVSVLEGV